ncbi:GGDEF domain-containing protein [Pseudomonas sp. R2.Fl]|nr:GGDEF domain-containing protein [Pseudomonas sp. R2.Fl]
MRGFSQQPTRVQNDALQRVAGEMAKQQVAGLPRNYELFHEALFGHDPMLARDLVALGSRPTQLHLDQIGLKYRLVSHCGLAEEKIQRAAVDILKNLAEMLTAGVTRKQTFLQSLQTISQSIRDDGKRPLSSLVEELDALGAAAAELTQAESALAGTLETGLARIEQAERVAQKAHEAAVRDRLTGLPNRVAFARRIEELYSGDAPRHMAVVAAEAFELDAFRRQYGEDAANRMLKRLAAILRKAIKKNDFVARAEGGQFLFIFNDVVHDDVMAIAERLRHAVETNLVYAAENDINGRGLELTVGFAMSDKVERANDILVQAQHALNTARHETRRPVVCYGKRRGGGQRAAA